MELLLFCSHRVVHLVAFLGVGLGRYFHIIIPPYKLQIFTHMRTLTLERQPSIHSSLVQVQIKSKF